MPGNPNLKKIDRLLTKDDLINLLAGKRILVFDFRHKFKHYNLIGYIKEVKE